MATDLGKKRRSVLLRCAAISAATLVLQLSLFWGTRPRPESTLQVSSLLAMIPGVELAPGAPLTFPSINDHAASLCPVECGSLVRNASIGIIETDGSTATRDMGVRLELVGSPALFQRIRALQVRPTTELLTADVPIGETHPGIMAQREQMTRAALLTLLACPRDKTVTSLQAAYGEEQGQECLLPWMAADTRWRSGLRMQGVYDRSNGDTIPCHEVARMAGRMVGAWDWPCIADTC